MLLHTAYQCKYIRRVFWYTCIKMYIIYTHTYHAGEVFIISNASPLWVSVLAQAFLPKLSVLVNMGRQGNNVYSAKTFVERKDLTQDGHKKWKVLAFKTILDEYFGDYEGPRRVISVGDGTAEMIATFAYRML
jgi:hypothetical protein